MPPATATATNNIIVAMVVAMVGSMVAGRGRRQRIGGRRREEVGSVPEGAKKVSTKRGGIRNDRTTCLVEAPLSSTEVNLGAKRGLRHSFPPGR